MIPAWGLAIIGGVVGWFICAPVAHAYGWETGLISAVVIMGLIIVVNLLLGGA